MGTPSILHGCAADLNAPTSSFQFHVLAGARRGMRLNFNDRGVVHALARRIHTLTHGIPRFVNVKYAISDVWSTGDDELGAGFDKLLDERGTFELTIAMVHGSCS